MPDKVTTDAELWTFTMHSNVSIWIYLVGFTQNCDVFFVVTYKVKAKSYLAILKRVYDREGKVQNKQ